MQQFQVKRFLSHVQAVKVGTYKMVSARVSALWHAMAGWLTHDCHGIGNLKNGRLLQAIARARCACNP